MPLGLSDSVSSQVSSYNLGMRRKKGPTVGMSPSWGRFMTVSSTLHRVLMAKTPSKVMVKMGK